MLTEKEKEAARSSRYFGGWRWGKYGNLGPAGLVAQLRGVTFSTDDDGIMTADHVVGRDGAEIAVDALLDITSWLEYQSVSTYFDDLLLLREKIFERAEATKAKL